MSNRCVRIAARPASSIHYWTDWYSPNSKPRISIVHPVPGIVITYMTSTRFSRGHDECAFAIELNTP